MSDEYDYLVREIDLSREHDAAHELGDHIAALRQFRRRSELVRSPLYRRLKPAIAEATFATSHRRFAQDPRHSSRLIRVVAWNIERGRRWPAILEVMRDNPRLRSADIVILNEVDVGMARSGNVDVARKLAEELGFDYVFGNCYLCLVGGNRRDGLIEDDNRLGMHGNAILSRYPIERAESFSVPPTHDIFETFEKRLGHRKALWARVRTPHGGLTVLCVHLDTEGSPAQRGRQMRRALAKLEERGVADAVVVGGDFNSSTYDTSKLSRLLVNIAVKLARGGFPHAMEHYLRPYEHYERATFRELEARGYRWREFNQLGIGSVRFEVGNPQMESMVSEFLPVVGVPVLRHKLKPWDGVAELKLDWFAGRGVEVLGAGELRGVCGRESRAPKTLHRTTWEGDPVSDHDPIAVDVVLKKTS